MSKPMTEIKVLKKLGIDDFRHITKNNQSYQNGIHA